jgi:hypothetical protein
MGFFRGLGVVICSVLLFLSLLIGGVCLTLGMSLSYNNVQPTVVSLTQNILSDSVDLNSLVQAAGPSLVEYCENNTDYVLSEGSQVFVIPCTVINQGNDAIVNYLLTDSINNTVNDYYYKQYDCKLVKCIEKGEITALISQQARAYWMSKFYLFLIISLVLIGLLFLLTEKKSNWFFLIGALFFVDSLIVSKLNVVGAWIAKALLLSIKEIFSGELPKEVITQVVSLFFLESRTVFYIMIGIGIIFLLIGIIFVLFKIGMNVQYIIEKVKDEDIKEEEEESVSKEEVKEIVEKEVKEKVKEEVSKQKNKNSSSSKKK